MKRVFWVRGQRRFFGISWLVFLTITFPILNFAELVSSSHDLFQLGLFDAICVVLVVAIALEVFVQRVEVANWGIQAFSMLNKARPPLTYENMTAYTRTTGGDWILFEGETIYRLPRIDKQQFHSVIAEFAPNALHAKPWNCGQLPPSEDFRNLSAFDLNLWLMGLVGAGMISLFLAAFQSLLALFYFLSSLLQISYELKNVFGRISIASGGVTVKWPWQICTIQWSELTAVFCERNGGRWTYFVLTAAGGRSIVLPSHILANPEVRRKFFYNIPDQTRCVNFDKMRFRRRGRGKKIFAGDESPGYSLDPQMMG